MNPSEQSGIWISRIPGSSQGRFRAPGGKIRVLIVDDHSGYRRGLRAMIEMESDIEAVGEADSGKAALEKVALLKPDIVLMDVNMPDMSGLDTTRKLAETYPGILVIMLTMFKGEEHLREARRAGASAYVIKDAESEVLLRTIRDVMSGGVPLLQQTSSGAASAQPSTGSEAQRGTSGTGPLMTSNERAILKLLASGLRNDQIAHRIGLTESMVRTYLIEIYNKLGLKTREEAIRYARDHGLAGDE